MDMGQILSNPYIEKEHHSGSDDFTSFGFCSMQGWRVSMEDAHAFELNVNSAASDTDDAVDHVAFYSIFDGHGGFKVAEFCGQNSVNILRNLNNFKNGNYLKAVSDFALEVDDQLIEADINIHNDHSGSTFTGVIISKSKNLILCANSGDSRTGMAINGCAKALSFDHKPSLVSETSRITNASAFVEIDRVNGNLALSRSMGDFEFKAQPELSPYEQAVTCIPDVIQHTINYAFDDFIMLACDGIWDCLSLQDCTDLVYYGIYQETLSLNDIAAKIIDVCCAPNTEGSGIGCDNMSIVIVALLQDAETEEHWFTRIRNKKDISHSERELMSFEDRRKKVFGYFNFDESKGHSVFEVTTMKQSKEDRNDSHNDSDLRYPISSEHVDTTSGNIAVFSTENPAAADIHNRTGNINAESNKHPFNLYTLNNILGSSGIQITRGAENGNDNSAFIHSSNLPRILASLGNTSSSELTNLIDNIETDEDIYMDDDDQNEDDQNRSTPEVRNEPDSAFR
ncbi:hypothetical protein TPHA_0E01010 [Tetrapisispora phaffii CBS 4417]|uniref:protein-serine/threonine phosphatase n=1 Tax=Tetrapisispora phaffii (strain ATCC 24235 / CBS 4417 / NBRC 1672 / NRRL Y-8282 / UCD 70-5) TaxID=1071381 RepID=G8BTG7_TETPH|nr:hypothetical protein TPHA_0E01010 [Tetrapisispora phaffii CBS 4417]CCE63195.1 hypothetical protein TPHA_0E01010 [Tetrapisispora phaffii CBS 4417]